MDSLQKKQKAHNQTGLISFADARKRIAEHHENPLRAVRFARGGYSTHHFYTEDSRRYVTPLQQQSIKAGDHIFDATTSFDTINHRYVQRTKRTWSVTFVYPQMRMPELPQVSVPQLSFMPVYETVGMWRQTVMGAMTPARAWNASLVGAMVFGMFSMAMIYKSLGQPAFATEPSALPVHEGRYVEAIAAKRVDKAQTFVETTLVTAEATIVRDAQQVVFEQRAREMVAGYPIENMLPEIFKLDRDVAAMMIAMAKQESQWGKRIPVLDGQDCLNYWGFRSVRERMGSGGHTCFDSTADAVQTVGRRVKELMHTYERTTAERMIVWKCGYSCDGHDQSNVASWKRTVQMYYDKLMHG